MVPLDPDCGDPYLSVMVGKEDGGKRGGCGPYLEAVKNERRPIWEFWPHDREGMILVPLIIVLTVALFVLLGGWAWSVRAASNRPAIVGLVCAVLGLVGVLAFWLSAPIILGGVGLTLGLEGRRRAGTEGRGKHALAAIVCRA